MNISDIVGLGQGGIVEDSYNGREFERVERKLIESVLEPFWKDEPRRIDQICQAAMYLAPFARTLDRLIRRGRASEIEEGRVEFRRRAEAAMILAEPGRLNEFGYFDLDPEDEG